MSDTVRTHDKFYLNEDRKNSYKESFKFIRDQIGEVKGDVLDVGCATGDFLWFLNKTYKNINLHGVDIDSDLVDRAKKEVPNASISVADITKDNFINGAGYDWIFMNGVHSIFDPEMPSKWLRPLVNALKNKSSTLCLFGIFNPQNLDVRISSRNSSSNDLWETGWNLISKKTIKDYCFSNNLAFDFVDFEIEIDIKKNESDPLRSWTMNMRNDKKIIINGLQLMHTYSLLRINKKNI